MSKQPKRQIRHVESGALLLAEARWCNSFWSKFRGFTLKGNLGAEEGLVLVEKADSRSLAAIHMFFVSFDLGIIWVNDAGEIVDKLVAKPWRPHYAPQAPARYTIELHPDKLAQVKIGDHIVFET